MNIETQKQANLLNNIEDNIVEVNVNVVKSDEEIVAAEKSQKNLTKKIYVLISIIVILLLVIGLIMIFSIR